MTSPPFDSTLPPWALFRADAVIVEMPIALVDDQLFPEELAHVASAVAKRRAEFGTGRLAARQALARLGIAPGPILPDENRVPIWPLGITGSIAHAENYCAVVVHRNPPVRAVGFDVEGLRPLSSSEASLILLPEERRWIASQPNADELVLLFFSAKEAYYKCQFPITRTLLEFTDVEINVDTAALGFEAHARRRDLPAVVRDLRGRYRFHGGLVFCGVELAEQG